MNGVWGLSEALELIRAVQPEVRKFGFHIALGGGVLNRGDSSKDLDLYFLPCVAEPNHEDKLLTFLQKRWGVASDIGTSVPDEVTRTEWAIYSHKLKFGMKQGRIDVFIVRKPTIRRRNGPERVDEREW